MKVQFEAEISEYNFDTGDMRLERSPYTKVGKLPLATTVDVYLPVPEFRDSTFKRGKRYIVTVEEVPE